MALAFCTRGECLAGPVPPGCFICSVGAGRVGKGKSEKLMARMLAG